MKLMQSKGSFMLLSRHVMLPHVPYVNDGVDVKQDIH